MRFCSWIGKHFRAWTKSTFFEIFKKSLKIFAKMHYFDIFFIESNKACIRSLHVWKKNDNCWEILRKYS